MAPIEGSISSPSIQEEIKVNANETKSFNPYDLNIHIKGKDLGGNISIRRESQKKPKKIDINTGQIIEKTCEVVAKGGNLEEITMRFVGK